MNKTILNSIFYLILILIIISLSIYASSKSRELKEKEHNILAMSDTIDTLRLSNGALIYEKMAFISKIKGLEDKVGLKDKEIRELENELDSKIKFISSLSGNVKIDSIIIKDTIIVSDDNIISSTWKYNDKWLSLCGITKIDQGINDTRLFDISMKVPLVIGLSENGNVFATSENPYVSFSDIDSYISELNKKHKNSIITVGLYGGFGASYGIIHGKFDFGPQIGIGVGLRIY